MSQEKAMYHLEALLKIIGSDCHLPDGEWFFVGCHFQRLGDRVEHGKLELGPGAKPEEDVVPTSQ